MLKMYMTILHTAQQPKLHQHNLYNYTTSTTTQHLHQEACSTHNGGSGVIDGDSVVMRESCEYPLQLSNE